MPARRPTEQKRRLGNPGRLRLPELVQVLPATDGVPPLRSGVGLDRSGLRVWDFVWRSGAVWIWPAADLEAVLQLARLPEVCDTLLADYNDSGNHAVMANYLRASAQYGDACASSPSHPTPGPSSPWARLPPRAGLRDCTSDAGGIR